MAKSFKPAAAKKAAAVVVSDQEQVQQWLNNLQHPLKKELLAVRDVILQSSPLLKERIKWNAPSYYCGEDMLTFNHRQQKFIQLVFHHPKIVQIESPLLLGDYPDRRLLHLKNMEGIKGHASELKQLIGALLKLMQES